MSDVIRKNDTKINLIFGITTGCLILLISFFLLKEEMFFNDDYEVIEQQNEIPKEKNQCAKNKIKEKSNTESSLEEEILKSNENKKEENIISYFKSTSETNDNKLKKGFITVVDFIFYEKELNGYTFEELTTSTKLKILSIALTIDNKIEQNFPEYQQTLTSNYQEIKSKTIKTYLNIITLACQNHESICIEAKKEFQTMKKDFGITWDFLKDLSKTEIDKLKDWYEIFRESE